MSKKFKYQNKNDNRFNKYDQQWNEDNNYHPIVNNYYNNNNTFYKNRNYNKYNNYNYHNNNYNYYNNNYYNNNLYNNSYRRGRGRYPYFQNRKYYREVELDGKNGNEIDEKFAEELKNIGFYIKEVKGDGNCLFRCVSEQIEENENNYEIYRQKCVEYMKENKDDFIPFLEENEPFDTYIEKISKDGEWGGNLEIYALSMALKMNFYIYIYQQPIYIVKNHEEPVKNIMLTYHNGKHYNSLRKLEEKKDEEKKEEDNEKKDNNENGEKKEENNEDNEKNKEKKKKIDDAHDLISKVNYLNI